MDFSLLGGPLHRLGRRLGLVRDNWNTMPLGLMLGLASWCVLLLLTLIEGHIQQMFSVGVIAIHARLIVAIPLFFICESLFDRRARMFVGYLADSGIVPNHLLPQLDAETARTRRWVSSRVPETLFLMILLVLSPALARLVGLLQPGRFLFNETAVINPLHAADGMSLAGWWYLAVALVLFRFLLIRWLWRLGTWYHYLWRVSRLDLHLIPTHPDETGGLGRLADVHRQFVPLILAISVLVSASFAESLASGTMELSATYPMIFATLIVDALLFVGPLLVFWPRLVACRGNGLFKYMVLASRYVNEFDQKWLHAQVSSEPLLGSADIQSLADLTNSVGVIRRMGRVPVDAFMLLTCAVAALLPMLPLLLFKYPAAELASQMFRMIAGF